MAFPAINTGIYGFPSASATQIAVATLREEADRDRSIEQVIFACFSPDVLDAYAAEGIDVADAAADPET